MVNNECNREVAIIWRNKQCKKFIDYATIEECVAACKSACKDWGMDYDDREVKLFMTDADGKWEVTEEGELAG